MGCLFPQLGHGAPLDHDLWEAKSFSGRGLKKLKDDDAGTASLVKGEALESFSLVIELKEPRLVYRIFVTEGRGAASSGTTQPSGVELPDAFDAGEGEDEVAAYPGKLKILVGKSRRLMQAVGEAAIAEGVAPHVAFTADVRFTPVRGRFIRLTLAEDGSGLQWRIGELEVFGFPVENKGKRHAIVLPENPTQQMKIGADELSVYLSELEQAPVPVINGEQENDHDGWLFSFELLDAGKTHHERLARETEGPLPSTPINVVREGRRIVFRAPSNKELLQSVWEFLERQGIRWLYPDEHGDFVPAGKGIDLAVLPVRLKPSSPWIYRNFGFDPGEVRGLEDSRDSRFFFWRNRYDSTWGNRQREVLGNDATTWSQFLMNSSYVKAPPGVDAAYAEGFQGVNHNFHSALPGKVFNENRSWCALRRDPRWAEIWMKSGSNLKLGQRWSWEGCFSHPGIADFFVKKVRAVIGNDRNRQEIIRIMPVDSVVGCECIKCMKLNAQGMGVDSLEWPSRPGKFQASGSFYPMIVDVADRVGKEYPNLRICVLPYGFIQACPKNIERFPDNLMAWLCLGQRAGRNLPVDSPLNEDVRQLVKEWSSKIVPGNLQHYDYTLLGAKNERAPVPMVSAIVDRAKLYQRHGLLEGGTEGTEENLVHNPWNFYVYPRIYWNAGQTADQLLTEFFSGFYREASEPMLKFYRAIERHHRAHNITAVHEKRWAEIPGAYPWHLLREMQRHLDAAEASAKNWVTRERARTMRNGFESVLQTVKVTPKQLASQSPGLVVKKGKALNLRGDRLVTVWGYGESQGRSGLYLFRAQGSAVAHIQFDELGTYEVRIESRSNGYENVWPVVTCHLEHRQVHQFKVDTRSFESETFTIEVEASGVQSLWLTYRNAATGGRRLLEMRSLVVERE